MGRIPAEERNLQLLDLELSTVPVRRNDETFDCQTWVLDALAKLKNEDQGLVEVFADIDENSIRAEMKQEEERWEVADDILHERLFK